MAGIPGFNTIEDVRIRQRNLLSLGSLSDTTYELKEQIRQKEIQRLESALDFLQTQEAKLIEKLGSIEGIQDRLEQWNRSSASLDTSFLPGGSDFQQTYGTIVAQIQSDWFNKNYTQEVKDEINNPNSNFYQTINSIITEDTITGKNKIIDKIVESLYSATKIGNRGGINLNRNIDELRQRLKLTIINQNNKVRELKPNSKLKPTDYITFDIDTEGMSSSLANQVGTIISRLNKKFVTVDYDTDVRQKISDYIIKKIGGNPNDYSTPQNAIASELIKNFVTNQNIDIHRNYPSAIGFLGEIYWDAFWKFIIGGNGVLPVGAKRSTGVMDPKTEIPIDLVFEDIGFQIKNYKINIRKRSNDYIRFPLSNIQIDNFVGQRLEMPNLIDPIQEFFFSYKYNRVFDEDPYAERNYGHVFKQFETVLKSFEKILRDIADRRIDKIIGLDRQFETDMGPIVDTDDITNQYNTAYIVGNKIILGSDIIKAMINALTNNNLESAVQISLPVFDFSYNNGAFSNLTYPDEGMYDGDAAMKGQMIKYQVQIDISKLVMSVIDYVNSIIS